MQVVDGARFEETQAGLSILFADINHTIDRAKVVGGARFEETQSGLSILFAGINHTIDRAIDRL